MHYVNWHLEKLVLSILHLSLFDCISYVTFSLACVGISILVYAPPRGSIYSEPLSGAPDNSLPRRVRDPSKMKKCLFYACYHANGGGPIFVTVSCLRLFVFTIVSFHMSYVFCIVVYCQMSIVCLFNNN